MTRLSAYVLAGDPVFLEQSLSSYYDLVDRIIVSFDESGLSWTGSPIPVAECLAIAHALDVDNKVVLAPGRFSDPQRNPLTSDTQQRQAALDVAGQFGDWVIQLDADEILTSPSTFSDCLNAAIEGGFDALDYPARWLYADLGRGRFLESSRRLWGPAMTYPGPLAVKSDSRLRLCRQVDASIYRVDVRPHNTDPYHPRDAPVHRVIALSQSVLHYSWARPLEALRAKAVVSGHVNDLDWQRSIKTWSWRRRHPLLAVTGTPLRRRGDQNWIRFSRVNEVTAPS